MQELSDGKLPPLTLGPNGPERTPPGPEPEGALAAQPLAGDVPGAPRATGGPRVTPCLPSLFAPALPPTGPLPPPVPAPGHAQHCPGLPDVPGYEVLGELGRGAMGVVYKARQVKLNRLVALKMILAGAHAGATELTRFRSEAEAIARLAHPNIVHIYEVGEHEGRPFFSLEFCPGGSLDRKLGGNPLPPREAAQVVEVLAHAVHAAHQQQVIHRDLKPANVLLGADGALKVTDFGLAKRLDQSGQTQ